MKNRKHRKQMVSILFAAMILTGTFTGCSNNKSGAANPSDSSNTLPEVTTQPQSGSSSSTVTSSNVSIDTTDLFTDRDLKQEADLSGATYYTVTTGENITITQAGVYVLSGTATRVTVTVEADKEAKVQLVLDGVSITNSNLPAIYVKSADKVFITTTSGSENNLEVTGTFSPDGTTNLDAVIFSKDDLVFNGTGTLTITCAQENGITSKDDLKVTGGTYVITSAKDSIEVHDSISICDGNFTIVSGKDAIHCEDSDDDTVGSVYIFGGTFNLTADDDGIQGTTIVQIDGGTITIPTAAEGIEGTYVIINGGILDIYATDDGINAASKSTAYDVVIEFNGGTTTINMGSGDVDAVDANGTIYVNDGNITINCNSAFDYDVSGVINGGTVIVNGEQITEMPAGQFGGGGKGFGGGNKGAGKRR